MVAKIDREEIKRSKSLLSRFLASSVLIAILVISVVSAGFTLYADRLAVAQTKIRLADSVLLLAPVIDGAVARGDVSSARQILRNFKDQEGVICVDYRSSDMLTSDDSLPVVAINLPQGGCAQFATIARDYIDQRLSSASGSAYHFLVDDNHLNDIRNQQLVVISAMASIIIIILLTVLSVFFRFLVTRPLLNLQEAMVASQPSKPVLAKIYNPDEIGAVSRSYNKLAAASRIYFARLDKFQTKLANSEEKFKDMAEVSGDWFYEMDADLKFTYISDRFFEIVPVKPEDIIGQMRKPAKAEDAHNKIWQAHYADLNDRREFREFEYEFVTPTQRQMIAISGKPIFDSDGLFKGYRGTGRDVTDITNDRLLLEETNRNFGDSVGYASAIQRRLLTKQDDLKHHLGQVANIWQPKDLVGGDFYWIGNMGSSRYLVFFDCTGHGVPGAFMTLITVSVLETIIAASPVPLPAAQMLEQIHRGVIRKLGITADKDGKDGLDCAVVKFNPSEGMVEFAGASIDLFHITSQMKVTRIRGDRASLGYRAYDEAREFTTHQLPIDGSAFVLMTDGMPTQIGADSKRVLGTRRIIEAMEAAGKHKPAALVRSLGRLLKQWQGNEERRDDVTVIAFNLLDE